MAPNTPPLLSKFARFSVADQVASALREAIRTGALGDPLPGEHQLAQQFGISRSSLRLAMAQLGADGLIIRRNGLRARLAPSRRRASTCTPQAVCVIYPVSQGIAYSGRYPVVVAAMRELFATKGIGWEEALDARFHGSNPDRLLHDLVARRKNICWILLACPAPVQRWFYQVGAPAFILGSCLPGVELPSIDIDHHAVGWHAAGNAIKHGHRHIGLLQAVHPLAGDLASQKGFLDYIAKTSTQVTITTILVDDESAAFDTRLRRLARSRQRPTVLFSNQLPPALRAIFILLQCGLQIPRDISLVVGDSHFLVDSVLPEITRYQRGHLQHAECAVRIAQALITGRRVGLKPRLFIPVFIAGSTLGPPALVPV